MKAQEINKTTLPSKKPQPVGIVKPALPKPTAPQGVKRTPAANVPVMEDDEKHYSVCGVKVWPGHQIHRHRKNNSDLWQKIRNWD
jgi:hypothetical protein